MNLPGSVSLALFLAATLQLHGVGLALEPGHIDGSFQAPILRRTPGPIWTLKWDREGKLWVGGNFGGYASYAFNPHSMLVRLTATGAIDSTFRGLGDLPALDRAFGGVMDLMEDSEGRLLGCGKLPPREGEQDSLIFFRLRPDGSVDPTFKGVRSTGVGMCMVWTGAGRLLLGGSFTECNGQSHTNLVRLLADGSIDSSFRPGFPLGGLGSSRVTSLTSDGQNRTYVSGVFIIGEELGANGFIRLNSNDELDLRFRSPFPAPPERVCVLQDSRLLVGATYSMRAAGVTNTLFRLQPNGEVDRTFDPVAQRILGAVNRISLDPVGRPWVIGSAVYRLSPTGDWDTNFVAESALSSGGFFNALAFDSVGDGFVAGGGWMGTNYDGIHFSTILRVKGEAENSGSRSEGRLEYERPPSFLHQGENLRLAALSSEQDTPAWQWYHHDRPLFRQTNAQLLIPDISTNHAGWYRAVARRENGTRRIGEAVRLIVYPDSGLGAALDTPGRVWITTGTPWETSTVSPKTGPTSVTSIERLPGTESWIQTRVFGPGTLEYWQRAELPGFTRLLRFQAGNTSVPMFVGSYPWRYRTVAIPAGWQTLTWLSEPQASPELPRTPGEGLFVDGVSFTPSGSERPRIVAQAQVKEVEPGGSADLFVFVDADPPLDYSWYRDGALIEGAKRQVLRLRNFTAADVGLYRVVVSPQRGSSATAVFVLELGTGTLMRLTVQPASDPGAWMLGFDTEPGGSYDLDRSPDLVMWTQVREIAAEDRHQQFLVNSSQDPGSAFYRVRLRLP